MASVTGDVACQPTQVPKIKLGAAEPPGRLLCLLRSLQLEVRRLEAGLLLTVAFLLQVHYGIFTTPKCIDGFLNLFE